MDYKFLDTVSVVSLITGVTSFIVTIIAFMLSRLNERKTLQTINERVFKNAILSSNIMELGQYLDSTLGQVTVAEYVSNKEIKLKVNNYIQNIISFIGTEEEISKVSIEELEVNNLSTFGLDIPLDLQKAARELRTGQPWNALAQLRRYIEKVLKEVLRSYQVEVKEYLPPSQILSILSSRQIIPLSIARDLKFVLAVCNKAIHGTDTTQAEAEEAFNRAVRALNEIRLNRK